MTQLTTDIVWMIINTSGNLQRAIADYQAENGILTADEIDRVSEEIEENANT